jgi:hypothetical protein
MDFVAIHKELQNTKLRLKNKFHWDDDFVNGAVNEYCRFLFLRKNFPDRSICPGFCVDEVWHDHILHTKNYIDFCEKMFGEYLHHIPKDLTTNDEFDPTQTIELYTQLYGCPPPTAYWFDKAINKTTNSNKDTNTNKNDHIKNNTDIYTYRNTSFDCRCGCK